MPRAVVRSGLPNSDPFPHKAIQTGAEATLATSFDHVVTVERNVEGGTDDWGNPEAADWAPHLVDQECLGFTKAAGNRLEGDPGEAQTVEVLHVLFPKGVDIRSNDRLQSIRDKDDDSTIFAGPFLLDAPPYRRTSYIEVLIEDIS